MTNFKKSLSVLALTIVALLAFTTSTFASPVTHRAPVGPASYWNQ